jgi:hypothetical protein
VSYAGTYGADETCRHDTYWRSCGEGCSLVGPRATETQIAEATARRKQEIADRQAEREAKQAERHVYRVVKDGLGHVIVSEEITE